MERHNMVIFAIVAQANIPTLRRKFEVHAAGCRDLRAIVGTNGYEELRATDVKSGLEAFTAAYNEANPETPVKDGDFYVQACTNMNRLRAAGRVFDEAPAAEPVAELADGGEPEADAIGESDQEPADEAVAEEDEVPAEA
jgi:hypothetical protein